MTSSCEVNRRAFLQRLAVSGVFASALRPSFGNGMATSSPHLVQFGHTDLRVSRICQGTAFRVNKRDPDDENGQAVLRRCIDIGINFFDSSNAYGWGGSELALGKAIRGRRSSLVICTKVHPARKPVGDKPPEKVAFTREFAFREAEGSLKRLGTDYIDLYLLHNPDGVTPLEELALTMDALVRDGKIRYWGVSNHKPDQVQKLFEIGAHSSSSPIAAIENQYSIVDRDLEHEMFPLLRRTGIGLLPFSPLDEGKLLRPLPPDQAAKAKLVAEVDQVGHDVKATRAQVLLAWVLSHVEATCVLCGAERPEHVEENFGALSLTLPAEAIARLNAASDAWFAAQSKGTPGPPTR
jgi:aryl-alcohol dehydrogenase-like predicted oxidoreductase